MVNYADHVVFDRQGQIVLLVEIKAILSTSSEWAAELLRNIFTHGLLPKVPYYLLALPDKFYLWTEFDRYQPGELPDYEVDSRSFLMPRLERVGIAIDEIHGSTFELIVSGWLNEILYFEELRDELDGNLDWLEESGLYGAIAGGRIEREELWPV